MRVVSVVLIGAASALSGCAGGSTKTVTVQQPPTTATPRTTDTHTNTAPRPTNDRRAIGEAIDGYFEAVADKDGDRACNLLTDAGKDRLVQESRAIQGPTECSPAAVAYADLYGTRVKNVSVKEIVVRGDTASASVEFPDLGSTENYELRRVDGEWKIDKWDSRD
jgi:hypothetical protein